jgi:CheY-like chemotaxis protein
MCSSDSPVILVVDDDAQVRWLVRHFLNRESWDVHEAANAAAAMEFLQQTDVDLLILDLFMPEQDGFEFLRKVRLTEHKFKILAISGYGEPYLQMAAHAGADAVMMKPFSREEFVDGVTKLLFQ